jgi:hypothetical protein
LLTKLYLVVYAAPEPLPRVDRVDRPVFVMPAVSDALWVPDALLGTPPGLPPFAALLVTVLGALEPPLEALLDDGTA